MPSVGFVWVDTEIGRYFTIVEVQQAHTHKKVSELMMLVRFSHTHPHTHTPK